MPRRHQGTKRHKVLDIGSINFVMLRDFEALWQIYTFGCRLIFIMSKNTGSDNRGGDGLERL